MGNVHGMVIYYVCKVIGWITVRLNQNHVIKFRIFYGNISIQFIMECGRSFGWNVLTDDKRLSLCQILLNLFLAQMQTVFIINHDFLALYDLGL